MKIKLLVVDDSAFMRSAIRLMVRDDPQIEVVGEARDGRTALQMVETLNPDVITMDVEMPGMDGVTATRKIMEFSPRPIIMLSSQTDKGSETTIRALEAGAVDYIPKKSSFVQLDIVQISNDLHKKIVYWGEQHLLGRAGALRQRAEWQVKGPAKWTRDSAPELVVIGASTGGPAIVPLLLSAMGRLSCPVIIAQHMPPLFTEGFARHLRIFTGLNVQQARDGMELLSGMVAVCPGGTDTLVREPFPGRMITSLKADTSLPIHPSIDTLFLSVSRLRLRSVAVIMTGMGRDGADGSLAMSEHGSPVLVQEPSECVVDGMPAAVISLGIASEVLSAEKIGKRLKKWAGVKLSFVSERYG